MSGTKENLVIQKGSTFKRTVRWESTPIIYKPISGLQSTAPLRVTVASHTVPDGWRVAITGVKIPKEVNAQYAPPRISDYHVATVIDANTLEFNNLNAQSFATYTTGGSIQFNTPVDLTGYTAIMQIRQSIAAATVALELTTANSRITLNNTNKTINIILTDELTAAMTISSGVYSLELVTSTGEVTQILYGSITVEKEVTRTV